MTTQTRATRIDLYPPEKQGRGSFDGGLITERKPIGFPGDGADLARIGPLFYWAWASAHGPGKIGLHPHQAFEIMSYVIEGEIGHYDTKGNRSHVGRGGAQVMQTGSGISHAEEMSGNGTEFFQIWFEPYLQEALRRPPTYAEYHHDDFPLREAEGVTIKTVIGPEAPISLEADAKMYDVLIPPGKAFQYPLPAGRSLAALTVQGSGTWEADGEKADLNTHDFAVLTAHDESIVIAQAAHEEALRLVLVDVPTTVDYPLYPKAR